MKARSTFGSTTIALLFMWAVIVAFVVGWVLNIVKFIGLIGGDISTWFIARAVGIALAPLGSILGYF